MSDTRSEKLHEPFNFYRDYYQGFLIILVIFIILMLMLTSFVMYQIKNRPLPAFIAVTTDGKEMQLTAHDEPNFLPDTLLRWAKKAAVASYTFDFANYPKQLEQARPFYTQSGWDNYRNSISSLLDSIVTNQVFVNGVVVGPPVITNEGDFTGHGFAWRIQMPFLVTTQGAETTVQKTYTLVLTIVKVPTNINPVGIGVDQFVMLGG